MKKKLLIYCILVLGIMTGCQSNNATIESNNDALNGTTNDTKSNCTVVECMKKINPENTVEEINNIIGFEGKLIDEKYNKYYWKLTDDTGVEVSYYSGTKGTIRIEYDRNSLANNKVDFSRYDELKSKINEGISYDGFISYIGGVEGTIIEKSSYSTKYVWVAKDGSYLNGSFSSSSGSCTLASGMIK